LLQDRAASTGLLNFASEHGSWNKAVRVGYEVIRIPLHQTGHASGEYENFLTGFVLPDGRHNCGFRWIAACERGRIKLRVES
jgi:hypothetical protein